jgi:hypothetical protein
VTNEATITWVTSEAETRTLMIRVLEGEPLAIVLLRAAETEIPQVKGDKARKEWLVREVADIRRRVAGENSSE